MEHAFGNIPNCDEVDSGNARNMFNMNGDNGAQHPSVQEFNWENFNKTLFNNIPTTIAEAMLSIMNFVLRFDLPWIALEDFLQMINIIFGFGVLPKSTYLASKIFCGMNFGVSFRLYCPDCQNNLRKCIMTVATENISAPAALKYAILNN